MPTLVAYCVFLKRQLEAFPCSTCSQPILPKHYETHCSNHHALNPKLCCVWCEGRVSWRSRHKKDHVHHLMPCARQFLAFATKPPPPLPPDLPFTSHPVPFDITSMTPKLNLFTHAFEPSPEAFESFWPNPLDPVSLPLATEGLTKAVACVRTYLRLRETTEWYHVKVRTVGFSAFVRAMNHNTRTLPFSCWCDGGQPTEARCRQHRHFIVVSPPGYYENWAKDLVPEDRPRKNFRCFYSKRIESPMHLVNTIGYLCQRSSQCAFAGKDTKAPEKANHFYLFEELPKGYRLPLVLQWEGGLNELLDQEHRHFNLLKLVRLPLFHDGTRWRLRIRDIPGIALGTVLPVARDYEPCDEETEAFVCLTGKRRMYFERNPELLELDEETWLTRQAAKGNLFYHAVGNDPWTPRPFLQTVVHDFKPLVDRIQDQDDRIKDLEARLARYEREAGPENEASRSPDATAGGALAGEGTALHCSGDVDRV